MIKISFCGVDDNVKINELEEISKRYSGVEFSILLHPGREGTDRYPTEGYINKFRKSNLNKSCHLCGDHIINIFNGEFGVIEKLYGFDRIQINATIENGVDIKKFRREDIIKNLLICIKNNPEKEWVLQYNSQTEDYCKEIMKYNIENVSILLDASCGLGIYTGKFPRINYDRKGYAGGLNINNIEKTISMLSIMGEHDYWLDMESGVRTDNKFDLDKVIDILKLIKNFISK